MDNFLVLHLKSNNKIHAVNMDHVRMFHPHHESGTWIKFAGDNEISDLLVREDVETLISFIEAESCE